jgi:type IV pilus biogenesis protein CpaD/CtpE
MTKTFALLAAALLACTTTLSACAPEKPWLMQKSTLNDQPLQLVEGRQIIKKPLSAMDDATVAEAARIYSKNGAGPLYMIVAYKDHGGKTGDGAVSARKAQIEASLLASGVAAKDIVSSTVPLDTAEPVALIAFDTLEATGPANCTLPMPGYDVNAEENNAYDYQTGCGVKNMMARQIATPTDLEGHAGLGGTAMGDHVADVVNGQYRPGAQPKAYLPSYVISELAGSGGQ